MQSAYGVLRAIVWALPALGFIGTAFEMAGAVGGLGTALDRTQGYNDLRNLLVGEVIPHLAGAFDITLFALGCSVVCYLLLSLAYAREERLLLEADAVSLRALAQAPDAPDGPGLERLLPEVQALTDALSQVNASLAALQDDQRGGVILPALRAILTYARSASEELKNVREALEGEMVVVRRPRPGQQGGGQ
jgi:hypothetical protein